MRATVLLIGLRVTESKPKSLSTKLLLIKKIVEFVESQCRISEMELVELVEL